MDDETAQIQLLHRGNALYFRLVDDPDPLLGAVLPETLRFLGLSPYTLTPEELADAQAELERRLRRVGTHDQVSRALARVRAALFDAAR